MFKRILSLILITLILCSTLSTSFAVLDNNMLKLTVWNSDSGNKYIADAGYVYTYYDRELQSKKWDWYKISKDHTESYYVPHVKKKINY